MQPPTRPEAPNAVGETQRTPSNQGRRGRTPHGDTVDVRAGDVLIVEEAGMAGTLPLARLVDLARQRGAVLRLIGDPVEPTAIESGNAPRLIGAGADVSAVDLDVVHLFTDPAGATATSALRTGDPAALAFYG